MNEKRRDNIEKTRMIERRRKRIHRFAYAILWFCLGFYVSEATHKANEIAQSIGLN